MEIATKFVDWEVSELSALQDSKVYQLRERLNKGGKLSRSEKNWLTEALHSNVFFRRSVPLMGWKFDFTDVLHLYWVKQYGQISEYYAIDKTALKSILYGAIDEIVELI
ncbi:molybdenum ABC transporter ATP-binding protein [Bacteroides timonensis]|uniref:molybdenum ABC transporter ATP-binding protein n=1 Tax=Bacteroides timonensis TaxID=1470345 RepID=UPI0004AF1794|nr:molybdenum ABC transporter ATP-binding protein [Bacteroides timonensis]